MMTEQQIEQWREDRRRVSEQHPGDDAPPMIERALFVLVTTCMVLGDIAMVATLSAVAAATLAALAVALGAAWLWWRSR